MTLDNTYSISEAVLALEKRHRRRVRGQASAAGTRTEDGPVDIVAVVSGVATLNSTLAASPLVATAPRVDLRIIDPSIPSYVVAKVSLHGSMEVARIAEEQISPGDILRFNRLRLGRHHHPQDAHDGDHDCLASRTATIDEQGAVGERFGNHNTLLHFEVSLDNPDPGFRWFKLGRIRIRTTQCDDDFQGNADRNNAEFDNHRGRPRAILSDDRRRASNFPQEMMTADSRIKELLAWYATRGGATGESSMSVVASLDPERNRGPSSMAMISVAGDANVRSLSPLPCKRRSLAEIQASSGLLSNLVVRVTHYDSQVIPLQSTTRRSGSDASPKPVRQRQVIGFGLVTDSSGVVMSFVDPGDRFGSYLRAGAEDPTKIIMMTNVMSKKQSEIFGRPLVNEEAVLWPTKQTTVSMLDHSLSDDRGGGGDDSDRRRTLPQACPSVGTASSDRSTRTRRVEGLEDDVTTVMAGREEFETYQQTQDMTTLDHLILLESSIDDILVNGAVSLRQCLLDWSPVDLHANMLTSDGREYKPVMIQLAMKSITTSQYDNNLAQEHYDMRMTSLRQNKSSPSLVQIVGSSVVQALCGGISPTEWKVETRGEKKQPANEKDDERRTSSYVNNNDPGDDEPTRTATRRDDEGGPTTLGWNVLRLLRALLHEDVTLTWRIDIRHDPPRVDSVVLPLA